MLALPDARLGRSVPAPLRAHGDANARAFKLRPRQAGTREGSASAPDADDRHRRRPPRTAQAAAPVTESLLRAGVSEGSGDSQLGLALSISPVTAWSLSSQCDLSLQGLGTNTS